MLQLSGCLLLSQLIYCICYSHFPYFNSTNTTNHKEIFGCPIEFTKIESDEGSACVQTLSGIFKAPSKHKKLRIVQENSQCKV
ncbi:unnamed protein product [Paramecium octaurelia]|uniref:Uncharacterized protein n=1 Tax=Paramecium octaurelia TaxID=43137 RepID=A0A8S1XW04_PAROT|nr:unnamed protein product [Paramecium octaurelia]